MTDPVIAAYEQQELERRERIPRRKAQILRRLAKLGIDLVEIPYDGEGDSGQLEGVYAYDAVSIPVQLPNRQLTLRQGNAPRRFPSLEEALMYFAWDLLDHYHCGFEIDDGGFGTIRISVPNGSITIDHNARVTDLDNTVMEV